MPSGAPAARCVIVALALTATSGTVAAPDRDPDDVTIGSKAFTESVILGEMLVQLASSAGARARHGRQLGGTRIVWRALLEGDIDAYPEYTGTLLREILADRDGADGSVLPAILATYGLRMTEPLGFNNSYALGVRKTRAAELGLARISDLRRYPGLALGFGNEFLDRGDGWRGLRDHYGLPQTDVRGLDHDLAYRGLASGALDIIDLYTTDAEIEYYDLLALEDDRNFFPRYDAVVVYRADLEERAPATVAAFRRLEGAVAATAMSAMNARVKLHGADEAAVAAGFLNRALDVGVEAFAESDWRRFWRHTREHLFLVGVSLAAALALAIPLGVGASRRPRAGRLILGIAGVLQTIPSLALFVFMIPLLGIGGPPAIVALFLYSLLPIIQNTYAGLHDIPEPIRESAIALGLSPGARLRLIELPLATRSILAGVKTAAVINVGTATLAALIGAGGFGQPILTGIRLDDVGLILQGAVPAAALALLVQGGFGLVERRLLPRSLRSPGALD
jgi:osmoprotectant transport system permease protein